MFYGWRAKLGVLVPSANVVTEPEFNLVTPAGVSCHYHRFLFKGGNDKASELDSIRSAAEHIAEASELIGHVHPSVIAMAGTAVSFIGGYGYDQILMKKIRERIGNIPLTTTSTSVIDSLKIMGIKRVSIATPYIEEPSRALIKFIEGNGVRVIKAKWLNKAGAAIGTVSENTLLKLAEDVNEPDSEAIFISCTSLKTFGLIEKLESDMKKPVITSNQATIWNMLRLAGVNDKIDGFGQLLSIY